VAHTCNPSDFQAKNRRIVVQNQPGKKVHETSSQSIKDGNGAGLSIIPNR
jgi:hypothetical protein